jgi:hypothetical protein
VAALATINKAKAVFYKSARIIRGVASKIEMLAPFAHRIGIG